MWKFRDRVVTESPEGYFGFIYLIENKLTGKIYVGKKQFTIRRKARITRKEKKATKTRKIFKQVINDSGWQDYNSSCKELQEAIQRQGEKNFNKIILEFCSDKRTLSYKEVWWQFKYNVLEVDSYNGNILGRYFKVK